VDAGSQIVGLPSVLSFLKQRCAVKSKQLCP
jgi:hypothetical protein